MSRFPLVTMYTKPGCGLCDEAEAVIDGVRAKRRFKFERQNILENFGDFEKYKHDIPVVFVNGREVARHHVDPKVLSAALNDARDLVVILMAKFPTPGRVKTRLVPPLTADDAARLHREFLLHLVHRLRTWPTIVCHDPPDSQSEMRRLLDADLLPQSGGDLADRLAAAAKECAAAEVIFLGADSPDVPESYLHRVAELLEEHDVVIAPGDDGGFWSVALSSRRVDPATLFAGIEWSSGREGAQTLERAKHLGYNVALADRWADVDRPEDLRRLLERLATSIDPDDQQLLARLSFLPPPLRDGVA